MARAIWLFSFSLAGFAQERSDQVREKMLKAAQAQREAAAKQWSSAVAAPSDTAVDPFWYTPWPKASAPPGTEIKETPVVEPPRLKS